MRRDLLEARAIVALGDDAGSIDEDGVGDHHPPDAGGIPDEEQQRGGDGRPMADLGAAALQHPGVEVGGVAPLQGAHGEPAAKEPAARGEERLPAAHAKEALVEVAAALPGARAQEPGMGVQPPARQADGQVGHARLDEGPGDAIEQDGPEGGQADDHLGLISRRGVAMVRPRQVTRCRMWISTKERAMTRAKKSRGMG